MIGIPPGVRVLVATKPVDFRKSADGLAAMVRRPLRISLWDGLLLFLDDGRLELDTVPSDEPCAPSRWDERTACSPGQTRVL